jgi:hypothetical protein
VYIHIFYSILTSSELPSMSPEIMAIIYKLRQTLFVSLFLKAVRGSNSNDIAVKWYCPLYWESNPTVPSHINPSTILIELGGTTHQKGCADSHHKYIHHYMTSITDYFTDNIIDYMYGETFYSRHTVLLWISNDIAHTGNRTRIVRWQCLVK